jgi:saccharopine dehydrogenase-like NADP-dependent oxidoreductase
MGSRAVEDLVVSEGVTQVAIADRNVEAARETAKKLEGKGAGLVVKEIDANDHETLVEAIRGHDVAASALGPFYIFEAKLIRAAIEAGVDYCSICDDWDPAEAVIDNLSEEAKRKDVTAIVGLGTSPGLSNVAVRFLSQQMDKIRKADVSVYLPLEMGGGPAALRHGLHIMSGEVPTWRDGKRVMIPACSEQRVVEFPQFGKKKAWNMGHSEPATIPRFIPGIEEVNFHMGLGLGASLVVHLARWGLFEKESRVDTLTRILWSIDNMLTWGEPKPGAVRIDVWGEKDDREVHRMLCGVGQMREGTGLSLSVGALMLGQKQILTEEGGVYAPEACLEPYKFLEYLNQRGLRGYEDIEMTRPII